MYNRIAYLRRAACLSRKDMAKAISVHPQTIGFLERGSYSPSVELALTIARYFGVPLEMVYSLEPFETQENDTELSKLNRLDIAKKPYYPEWDIIFGTSEAI